MVVSILKSRTLLPALTLTVLTGCIALPVHAQYSFLRAFGTPGANNGQFNAPEDVVIDSTGNIFVLDSGNNRVQKFDNRGNYLSQFGSQGAGSGQFQKPLGIGIDNSNNIFVADTSNNLVQTFDNNGTFLSQFGPQNNGDFNFPADVAVRGGSIFVTDSFNKRVEQFNSSGVFQSSFGSNGSGDGQFGFPFRIATDSTGNIFVTDPINSPSGAGNNRIAEFNSSGNFVRNITYADARGTINPNGIAVDATTGNLFVADFSNNRVIVFSNTGTYLTQFGTTGSSDGQFNGADGVALDSSGNVFVTDFGNNRVEEFGLAPVPEAGTLLMLAGMTAGGIFVIRRKQKPQMPVNS